MPPPPRRVRVVDDNANTVYDLPLPYYEDVYPARSNEKEEEIGRAYDRCDEESSDDDLDSEKGKKRKMTGGGTVQHVRFFSPVGLGVKPLAGEGVNVNVNVNVKGRKDAGTNISADFAAPKTLNDNTATTGAPSSREVNKAKGEGKLLTPKKFGMFSSPPASSSPPPMSSPAAPEMNTAAEVMDDLLSGRPSVDAEEKIGEDVNVEREKNGDQTATTLGKEGKDHAMVDTAAQMEGEKSSDADVEDNADKVPMKSAAGKKRKRDMQTVDASKIKSHRTRGQERREMEKVEAEKKAAKPAKRVKTKTSPKMGRSKCGRTGGWSGRKRAIVEVYEDETDAEQYVRWE